MENLLTCRKENLLQSPCFNLAGFAELLAKFEKKIGVAGKSKSTRTNYSRHQDKLDIHFNDMPTG